MWQRWHLSIFHVLFLKVAATFLKAGQSPPWKLKNWSGQGCQDKHRKLVKERLGKMWAPSGTARWHGYQGYIQESLRSTEQLFFPQSSPGSAPATLPKLWRAKRGTATMKKKHQVWNHLRKLKVLQSIRLAQIHPRAPKELAEVIVRPQSIIFEKLWQFDEVPTTRRSGNITSIFKNRNKWNRRTVGVSVLPLGLRSWRDPPGNYGKAQGKQSWQHPASFTKGKLCQTNLVAFDNRVEVLVDERRVTDVIYPQLHKASDTDPHNVLCKLEKHGFSGG